MKILFIVLVFYRKRFKGSLAVKSGEFRILYLCHTIWTSKVSKKGYLCEWIWIFIFISFLFID